MITPTPEIRKALYQHLIDVLPIKTVVATDVAWPNVPFKPVVNRVYLEPYCLFGETEEVALSPTGFEQLNGIFQITVYGVLNTGESIVEEICRELVDDFRAGTQLALPNGNPLLLAKSYRSSMIISAGNNTLGGQIARPSVVVSINWKHFVPRGA